MSRIRIDDEEFILILFTNLINKYTRETNKLKKWNYKRQMNDINKYIEEELHKELQYDKETKILSLKDKIEDFG